MANSLAAVSPMPRLAPITTTVLPASPSDRCRALMASAVSMARVGGLTRARISPLASVVSPARTHVSAMSVSLAADTLVTVPSSTAATWFSRSRAKVMAKLVKVARRPGRRMPTRVESRRTAARFGHSRLPWSMPMSAARPEVAAGVALKARRSVTSTRSSGPRSSSVSGSTSRHGGPLASVSATARSASARLPVAVSTVRPSAVPIQLASKGCRPDAGGGSITSRRSVVPSGIGASKRPWTWRKRKLSAGKCDCSRAIWPSASMPCATRWR